MTSITDSLKTIRNHRLRAQIALLVLTLGKDARDQVICKNVKVLEYTPDNTSVKIETNRISLPISEKKKIKKKRIFLENIAAEKNDYIIQLLNNVIAMSQTGWLLPPVAEDIDSSIISHFESIGGTKTLSAKGGNAIILPLTNLRD